MRGAIPPKLRHAIERLEDHLVATRCSPRCRVAAALAEALDNEQSRQHLWLAARAAEIHYQVERERARRAATVAKEA
jgi:hypothetical protein